MNVNAYQNDSDNSSEGFVDADSGDTSDPEFKDCMDFDSLKRLEYGHPHVSPILDSFNDTSTKQILPRAKSFSFDEKMSMKRRSSRELSQGVASSIPARGSNSLHIDIPPMGSQAVSRETSRQSPVPIPGEQSSSSQASATSWHCFFPFFQSKFKHDYVHVHKSNKSVMEFNRLKHIQTYSSHIGPIWCMKFSHDGRFLATGGKDMKIIIWSIGKPPRLMLNLERSSASDDVQNDSNDSNENSSTHTIEDKHKLNLLNPTPYHLWRGHTADVTDLSWSHSHFVLSASADKTVRLWNIFRADCLGVYKHSDVVTSIDFHPLHDSCFISGCFDKKLCVWEILPEPGNLKSWMRPLDKITCVAFSPDGKTIVAGLIQGQIYVYDYDAITFTLKYRTIIECRNRQGSYHEGRKVTGLIFEKRRIVSNKKQNIKESTSDISTNGNVNNGNKVSRSRSNVVNGSTSTASRNKQKVGDDLSLLVTTNDNRIRLFDMNDYFQLSKYKSYSYTNNSMQIKATLSADSKYVICGSEDGHVYIWSSTGSISNTRNGTRIVQQVMKKKNRNDTCEYFDGTLGEGCAATVALFVPDSSIAQMIQGRTVEDASLLRGIIVADVEGTLRFFVNGL